MTSSSGFIPRDLSEIVIASVQLPTPTPYLQSWYEENFSSNSSTFGPNIKVPLLKTSSTALKISSLNNSYSL